MANSYHKGFSGFVQPEPATALFSRIDDFIQNCRSPAVLEFGEETMPLRPAEFSLELRSGRVWIDVWHENRTLSRRILAIQSQATGVLDCSIQRFGGTPGKLTFLDLDRPQTAHRTLSGIRHNFGEQFRRMLSRQLPGWELRSLSAAMDLQRSFSPLFPRARLVRGQHQIAAIACPDPGRESAFLTFALLWLSHMQTHAGRKMFPPALYLFLPEDCGALTAHRLRWLHSNDVQARLFLFNGHGAAGEIDPNDLGNLDTTVKSRCKPPHLSGGVQDLLRKLSAVHGVGVCPEITGAVSVRFHGVEFARIGSEGRLCLGIESSQDIAPGEFHLVEQFAAQLQLIGPTLASQPERWLESAVRSHVTVIDPALQDLPVHSQVLSMSGRNRDSLDLLAVSNSGRLTVMELKAVEDIHLPMQALDYWTRVMWHARRGELDHLFPNAVLRSDPPRLLLLAPALSFHSANQTVIRYFSPEIDVERIGINSDWQSKLRVVLRLSRGDQPQSHQTSHEQHPRLIQH